MKNLLKIAVAIIAISAAAIGFSEGQGRGNGPVIFVTSQGLFYDSIVLTDLPQRGRFQKLEMGGPSGLMTEWGPGDHDYVGGRWWLDANNNDMMDAGDAFFMCPLLGPGRTTR